MATIPASQIVRVIPGVLSAGGDALDLIGLMLTQSTRVPIGTVSSFADAPDVGAFFGLSSKEFSEATVYFNGFDNSTQKPAALLFAQYPSAAVPAYLQSAPVTGMTLQQIQGMSGSLTVTFDGAQRTAPSISLSGATSYSAAAALIQAALNANEPSEATFTGSIAPQTANGQAFIAGNQMTVSSVANGAPAILSGAIVSGSGVLAGTQVTSQISGTTGAAGVYEVNLAQVVASTAITAAYGLLTVSAVAQGTVSVGQTLAGTGVSAGTLVTALGTGTGLAGTYAVTPSQTVTSGTLQAVATNIVVTFDPVSGGFIFTSGVNGSASSAGFATGTLAAALFLTQTAGAVVSQGADAAQPGPFMTTLIQVTQNWASFMTLFDPDGGSGNAQKLAFAQWTNAQADRFAYVCRDFDTAPTLSNAASTSLGAIIQAANLSGTFLMWAPAGSGHAAFALGVAASIDFDATNGRTTYAFRQQTGLTAAVTNATVAQNLIANGYNYYGAYATANENFVFLYPGAISGPYLWADSYIDQIWLNNALQLALIELLINTKSIPYDAAGYALVTAACLDPINQAINFGAIRVGVSLSQAQQAEINQAAGKQIASVVTSQGYYLQVLDATSQVRAARASPPCNLWYADGQSIQKITLNSIQVQ